jgi:hypothetical protein
MVTFNEPTWKIVALAVSTTVTVAYWARISFWAEFTPGVWPS